MSYDPHDSIIDPVTDQHYAAIGYVAAKWAYLEAVIDDWTLRLGRISAPTGVCLTSQIAGSGRKLDAFIALARLHRIPKRLNPLLEDFAKSTAALAERRNRAVHDPWDVVDPRAPRRLEATARKKLRLEYVEVQTAELIILAATIDRHRETFETLAEKCLTRRRP